MRVIATMQSNDGKSDPYPLVQGRNLTETGVFLCVAQLLEDSKSESPWAPRILEIKVVL